MKILKRNKKTTLEAVQEFLDELQQAKFTVSMHKKQAEKEIKKSFSNNKIPNPGLLSRWKSYILMDRVIEGAIQTAKHAVAITEIQEKLAEVANLLGKKELHNALSGLDEKFRYMQDQLMSLLKTESSFITSVKQLENRLTPRLDAIEALTEDVQEQAIDLFGEDLLEFMKIESPEIYDSIPEDLKKKLGDKNSAA